MKNNNNEEHIYFYEPEYFVFCNYSAYAIEWNGKLYMTSEHAYHSEKFEDEKIKEQIRSARSAHDAHIFAEVNKDKRRKDWDKVKLGIMKEILRAKVEQHPYVREKLMQSEDGELIENSPTDSYWGWGPNKDGENHLGRLWMEIRQELKEK